MTEMTQKLQDFEAGKEITIESLKEFELVFEPWQEEWRVMPENEGVTVTWYTDKSKTFAKKRIYFDAFSKPYKIEEINSYEITGELRTARKNGETEIYGTKA